MTVAELIQKLEAIEDKTLPVGYEYDCGFGWATPRGLRLDHKSFGAEQGVRLMVMLEEE